jgi:hypothetical protein
MTTNQTPTTVPTTELGWALHTAQRNAEMTRQDLVRQMRALAENMATEANRLEADADRTVNSLGEVQGQGLRVDLLCRQLCSNRETVAMLAHLVARGADSEA